MKRRAIRLAADFTKPGAKSRYEEIQVNTKAFRRSVLVLMVAGLTACSGDEPASPASAPAAQAPIATEQAPADTTPTASPSPAPATPAEAPPVATPETPPPTPPTAPAASPPAAPTSAPTATPTADAAGEAPAYQVQCPDGATAAEQCQVDKETYIGWRTFAGQCQVCHGGSGLGSTFAPNLLDRFHQRVDYPRFVEVVTNGYTGQVGAMPAWKGNPNVEPHIDRLYSYLKARADGVLPAGRPARLP